jgi:hypothetical protein
MLTRLSAILLATMLLAGGTPAAAHHEALFGPQSGLILSGDRYASVQVFSRRTGTTDLTRETTTVLSGGLTPRKGPLSLAVVLPFSLIHPAGAAVRGGIENVIVAARYRMSLPAVTSVLSADESYVLGVGGAELPTGTVDYDFWDGAPAMIAATLFGFERRPVSAIGYGFLHRYAERHGVRDSGNAIVGGGAAWTPIDAPERGRLFSLQFGLSREESSRDAVDGVELDSTGGWAIVAHPTIVVGLSKHTLLFAVTSVPLRREWRNPDDREGTRIGVGTILTFGH